MRKIWLIVTDSDKKVFNVLGPMTDDRHYVKLVCRAQDLGRQVSCCDIDVRHLPDRSDVIAEHARSTGYAHTDDPVVYP